MGGKCELHMHHWSDRKDEQVRAGKGKDFKEQEEQVRKEDQEEGPRGGETLLEGK